VVAVGPGTLVEQALTVAVTVVAVLLLEPRQPSILVAVVVVRDITPRLLGVTVGQALWSSNTLQVSL
jgi:hypothetical protein